MIVFIIDEYDSQKMDESTKYTSIFETDRPGNMCCMEKWFHYEIWTVR